MNNSSAEELSYAFVRFLSFSLDFPSTGFQATFLPLRFYFMMEVYATSVFDAPWNEFDQIHWKSLLRDYSV